MKSFRDFYADRYGVPYPGKPDEGISVVLQRIAEGVAEYTDYCQQNIRIAGQTNDQ